NKIAMEIEVNPAVVEAALNKAYRKIVKQVNVPGFRKGKVPRSILEARFGPEVLYEEALETLIPEAYEQAVGEADIEPIDTPEFDLVQMEKGKPLLFKAVVEVKPDFELPEYKGIKIEKKLREITDVDVEEYLKMVQKQHARLVSLEDTAAEAKEGDLVVIDFKGFIDGEAFSGGEAEGYSLELGSNSFIPGFETQLIGIKKGEEREVKVVFPEDYREKTLAGKEALFKVKAHEIKRKEYPLLNDDFAKEISEFATLEEFKQDIKNKLKKNEEVRAEKDLEERLVQQIVNEVKVEAPVVLVDREMDRMMQEMEQFMRMQGLSMEQYLKLSGKSAAELRENNRDEAIKRVISNLTLSAIIKKEGITAEESEIDDKIKSFAESYKQDFAKVKEVFAAQGRLGVIEDEIKYGKVIELLKKEADIVVTVISEKQEEAGEGKEETLDDKK
ncbi:MAG TPA: trigger factor, partial [Firmicutes bacterium]|nr:trigger factor [Bacillota bacterium]